MNSKVRQLENFKTLLVRFIDELAEMFPKESDFVVARHMIKDKVLITDVIEYFKLFVLPYKADIQDRSKSVIISRIFSIGNANGADLPRDKIDRYSKIYDGLAPEDRTSLWEWVEVIVAKVEEVTLPSP